MAEKLCPRCERVLAAENFNRYHRGGLQSYCRGCMSTYKREWHAARGPRCQPMTEEQRAEKSRKDKERYRADPERAYWSNVRRKYGLTADEVVALGESQQWRCASCGAHRQDCPRRKLFIDHHAATGAVRGLLCHGCNCALGLLGEDLDRILGLADYHVFWTERLSKEDA